MSVGGRCEMKMVMKAEKEGNEGVFVFNKMRVI